MRVSKTTILTLFLLLLGTVAAAAGSTTKTQPPTKDGRVKLFDGKTLEGWQTLNKKPIKGWTAKDETLTYSPPKSGGGNDIYTVGEYANFVLELEWKIGAGQKRSNSGIKYRMHHYDGQYLGPEYQILGTEKPNPGNPKGLMSITAALYVLVPADLTQWKLNPPGQWNQTRIVANGNHLEHWLNKKCVMKVDTSTEAFKKAVARSKFKKWPHYAQNKAGRIMLQDHGNPVTYRNISIKVLP